jgi:hypothetical protein
MNVKPRHLVFEQYGALGRPSDFVGRYLTIVGDVAP